MHTQVGRGAGERVAGGGRGKERESQAYSGPSMEPDMGLNAGLDPTTQDYHLS